MPTIAASEVRTCLGNGAATFGALLAGRSGVADLRYLDPVAVGVTRAYQCLDGGDGRGEAPGRAARWLTACLAGVLRTARLPADARVAAVVGTGLRGLRAVELWALDGAELDPDELDATATVRTVAPFADPVLTVANACSASGHALALAQDLLDAGDVDAVLVAGVDTLTASMLAMIGRVHERPTERVRPFDADRTGVLLGEGAAAFVLVPDGARCDAPLGRLLATGLSCDAHHETAPDRRGIVRAMEDALRRAGRAAAEVDLVVTHGTGTAQNDVVESAALREVLLDRGGDPLVTGIKGGVGHTSGASALMSVDVALRAMDRGEVPPAVGLRHVLPEGAGLRFVVGKPVRRQVNLAQIDAFGFGGVNAVNIVAAASRQDAS